MKKYKLGYIPYLLILSSLIVMSILVVIFLGYNFMWYFICIPIIIIQCISIINMFFLSYISVDKEGISQRTWIFRKFISRDSMIIACDEQYFMFKYCVSIYGDGKKILIYNWTKNSKELIKIIIDECKTRDKKVEILVEKIIED
ncbi:MAG: hypothetical protein PHX70_06470 [Clostridium sp.]|nr:hypothetical protein [Clostridium sp.]